MVAGATAGPVPPKTAHFLPGSARCVAVASKPVALAAPIVTVTPVDGVNTLAGRVVV
jgi:hypothetical protein